MTRGKWIVGHTCAGLRVSNGVNLSIYCYGMENTTENIERVKYLLESLHVPHGSDIHISKREHEKIDIRYALHWQREIYRLAGIEIPR
jgi:hypothetical protein